MPVNQRQLDRSISACLANSRNLLDDAEWSVHPSSIGLALALLAQEECAKAFILTLVRDEILPWTGDVRRALSEHHCKHLVTLIMEWLCAISETRLETMGSAVLAAQSAPSTDGLPCDVATAMNIFRHEMIERIGKRYPTSYPEWRGNARKVADGNRERRKHAALYVSIGADGDVTSQPPSDCGAGSASQEFKHEFARAKLLREFTSVPLFARPEYLTFAEIFKAMCEDLAPDYQPADPEEVADSGIPGVQFVSRKITVADVDTDVDN